VWERDVPFEVLNRPGEAAVRATIMFEFRRGASCATRSG
jgi:hypothetical protein